MNTNTVRWDVINQSWIIKQDQQWHSLDSWASDQPDMSQISLILSASSYLCRWVELPGVNSRHLSRALPFALEESLIEDIDVYHLVPAGKQGKANHRVYISNSDILDRLRDSCELHNLHLRELLAETSQLPANSITKDGDDWLINIAGITEARVSQQNISAYLELALNKLQDVNIETLKLYAENMDEAKLLKTQLETSFPQIFTQIDIQVRSYDSVIQSAEAAKPVNLLTGEFRAAEIKEDKPSAWWRPLAAIAAVWCVFMLTDLALSNKQLQSQQAEVHKQTLALYKRLFPGERIRSLERNIKSKLNGQSTAPSSGFLTLMHQSSKVLGSGHSANINWQSFKFNDRQNLLLIDLTATSIAQLQAYKADLEKAGLSVEIASATNEEKSVKGRLKIGGAS